MVQSEKARKNAENELEEETSRVSELTVSLSAAVNDKRRMEADAGGMRADAEEAINGRRAAEDRADRLQNEVSDFLMRSHFLANHRVLIQFATNFFSPTLQLFLLIPELLLNR